MINMTSNVYICTPNPKSTYAIDKIMAQHKVSSFQLSIFKSEYLYVDKYSCTFNATLCNLNPIDVKSPLQVNFPGFIVVENKDGTVASYINNVPDPSFIPNNNISTQDAEILSQYIDTMLEKASLDGSTIYIIPPNSNDQICVWPAFHTHDQANILLDLKSPLA